MQFRTSFITIALTSTAAINAFPVARWLSPWARDVTVSTGIAPAPTTSAAVPPPITSVAVPPPTASGVAVSDTIVVRQMTHESWSEPVHSFTGVRSETQQFPTQLPSVWSETQQFPTQFPSVWSEAQQVPTGVPS